MKFYLPQVLPNTQNYGLTKKKSLEQKQILNAKPNLGNSHLLNPPLLNATGVFQPLLPYHSQWILGKRKVSKFKQRK